MSDETALADTKQLAALAAELRDLVPRIDSFKEVIKPMTDREHELRNEINYILSEHKISGFRGAEGIQLTMRQTKTFQITDQPALLLHLHAIGQLDRAVTLEMKTTVDKKAVEMIHDSLTGGLQGVGIAVSQSLVVKIADKVKEAIHERTMAEIRGDQRERIDAIAGEPDPLMNLLDELEAKSPAVAQLGMLAAPWPTEPSLPDSDGNFTEPTPAATAPEEQDDDGLPF